MSISFSDGPNRVRFSGQTDIGKVRDHNEDDLLIPTSLPLAAVADGMGGHASGEVASRIAVETVERYYLGTADDSPRTWPFRLPQLHVERDRMVTAVKLANALIYQQGAAETGKKGMGCTLDAIFFGQGRYYIGHVGDSRVYRIRGGQIVQLTEDHSLLNDYRRMQELSGEELESFPHKNVVVRALGLGEHVFVDLVVDEYQRGDLFLLCSDGLSSMVPDLSILEICSKFDNLDRVAKALVEAANAAGGADNITAVLARIEAN